jgi:hypothetical protein
MYSILKNVLLRNVYAIAERDDVHHHVQINVQKLQAPLTWSINMNLLNVFIKLYNLGYLILNAYLEARNQYYGRNQSYAGWNKFYRS